MAKVRWVVRDGERVLQQVVPPTVRGDPWDWVDVPVEGAGAEPDKELSDAERLGEFIVKELLDNGFQIDNLGDAESVVFTNRELPALNVTQLAEMLLAAPEVWSLFRTKWEGALKAGCGGDDASLCPYEQRRLPSGRVQCQKCFRVRSSTSR